MQIVIDTNAYVAYMQGDQNVFAMFGVAERTLISVIVLGELYAGFQGGTKYLENKKRLEQFLQKSTAQIIQITQDTSEIFGRIKNQLKINGTPIPLNDIWLAAQSIETGSVMVTYDQHFTHISELRLWHGLKDGEQ
ncbi:MAG: tRNA(fMet)-specific endonuclease VapC [Candidatus Latescibacterota bacterium]|jgi:tRNA(fMet)-specific endonuclease VapC